MKELIQIISLFFGSMGFALVFNLDKKVIIHASLGGALSWCAYLVASYLGFDMAFNYFVSALFLGLFSETFARVLKRPTTLFWVVGFIPLIPGFSLYYTMHHLVNEDFLLAKKFWFDTITISSSLGIGIVCSFLVFRILNNYLLKLKKQ